MSNGGMVYLVGAGPGDPGLMTLKGRGLLESCQAVVYDHLASEEFLDWTPEGCRKIYVGKQAGRHSMSQDSINHLLVELALSGLMVVRLKGGDPFVFGRGGEEILALEAENIPYELVPGVTSAVAVPECAGIPVTHRAVSRSFHVIAGHTKEGEEGLPPEFEQYGSLPGTLVFLMGLGRLPSIIERLTAGGKSPDTPAAVIERGTLPGQRVVRAPLSQIQEKVREAGLTTPAIIVVGETASYEMKCSTKRDAHLTESNVQTHSGGQALSGIRVGITGTEQFAVNLAKALEEKGAKTSWLLNMKVISHGSEPPVKQAYKNLEHYTWLVLTSANGVRLFFKGLLDQGRDYRSLGHLKFAVIGDGTGRELAGYGFKADYMPDSFCAQALAAGLAAITGRDDRLLIARSKGGSPILTKTLEAAGIAFDDIALYEVAGAAADPADGETGLRERFDYLTFASASGVRAYLESGLALRIGGAEPDVRLACIGGITAGELEKRGLKAHVTAKDYHIKGLVEAIIKDVISSNKQK